MSQKNFNQIGSLDDLNKYFNDAQSLDEKSFVELVKCIKDLKLKLGFNEFTKLFKLAPKYFPFMDNKGTKKIYELNGIKNDNDLNITAGEFKENIKSIIDDSDKILKDADAFISKFDTNFDAASMKAFYFMFGDESIKDDDIVKKIIGKIPVSSDPTDKNKFVYDLSDEFLYFFYSACNENSEITAEIDALVQNVSEYRTLEKMINLKKFKVKGDYDKKRSLLNGFLLDFDQKMDLRDINKLIDIFDRDDEDKKYINRGNIDLVLDHLVDNMSALGFEGFFQKLQGDPYPTLSKENLKTLFSKKLFYGEEEFVIPLRDEDKDDLNTFLDSVRPGQIDEETMDLIMKKIDLKLQIDEYMASRFEMLFEAKDKPGKEFKSYMVYRLVLKFNMWKSDYKEKKGHEPSEEEIGSQQDKLSADLLNQIKFPTEEEFSDFKTKCEKNMKDYSDSFSHKKDCIRDKFMSAKNNDMIEECPFYNIDQDYNAKGVCDDETDLKVFLRNFGFNPNDKKPKVVDEKLIPKICYLTGSDSISSQTQNIISSFDGKMDSFLRLGIFKNKLTVQEVQGLFKNSKTITFGENSCYNKVSVDVGGTSKKFRSFFDLYKNEAKSLGFEKYLKDMDDEYGRNKDLLNGDYEFPSLHNKYCNNSSGRYELLDKIPEGSITKEMVEKIVFPKGAKLNSYELESEISNFYSKFIKLIQEGEARELFVKKVNEYKKYIAERDITLGSMKLDLASKVSPSYDHYNEKSFFYCLGWAKKSAPNSLGDDFLNKFVNQSDCIFQNIVIVDDIDAVITNKKDLDRKFYVTKEHLEIIKNALKEDAKERFDKMVKNLEKITTYLIHNGKHYNDIKMLNDISEKSIDEKAVNEMKFPENINFKTFMSYDCQRFILEFIKRLKDDKAVIALWKKIDEIVKNDIDFSTLMGYEYQNLLKQIFDRLESDESKVIFCADYERQKRDVAKRSIELGENCNEETDVANEKNFFYGVGKARKAGKGTLGELNYMSKYMCSAILGYKSYQDIVMVDDVDVAIANKKDLDKKFYITKETIETIRPALNKDAEKWLNWMKFEKIEKSKEEKSEEEKSKEEKSKEEKSKEEKPKPYLYYKGQPIYNENSLSEIFKIFIGAKDVENITFPKGMNLLTFVGYESKRFYEESMKYFKDIEAKKAFCKKFNEFKEKVKQYNIDLAKNRTPKTDEENKGNFFYGLGIAKNSASDSLDKSFINRFMEEKLASEYKVIVVDDSESDNQLNDNSTELDFTFEIQEKDLKNIENTIESESKKEFMDIAEKFEELDSHLNFNPLDYNFEEMKDKFKKVKDPKRVARKAYEFLSDLFGSEGKYWDKDVMSEICRRAGASNNKKEEILRKAGRCIIFLLTVIDDKKLSNKKKGELVGYMQNAVPDFGNNKANAFFAVLLAVWQIIKGIFTLGKNMITSPVYSAFMSSEKDVFRRLVKGCYDKLQYGKQRRSKSQPRTQKNIFVFKESQKQKSDSGMNKN